MAITSLSQLLSSLSFLLFPSPSATTEEVWIPTDAGGSHEDDPSDITEYIDDSELLRLQNELRDFANNISAWGPQIRSFFEQHQKRASEPQIEPPPNPQIEPQPHSGMGVKTVLPYVEWVLPYVEWVLWTMALLWLVYMIVDAVRCGSGGGEVGEEETEEGKAEGEKANGEKAEK